MWSCIPTNPGISVIPVPSIATAPFPGAPFPMDTILPFAIATVWSSSVGFPVPSTTRTCVIAMAGSPCTTNGCNSAVTCADAPHAAARVTPQTNAFIQHSFKSSSLLRIEWKIKDWRDVHRDAGHLIKRLLQVRRHRPVLSEPAIVACSVARRLDLQQLLAKRSDSRRKLLLDDPITPVGRTCDRALLRQIVELHHLRPRMRLSRTEPDRTEDSRHIRCVVLRPLLLRQRAVLDEPAQPIHADHVRLRLFQRRIPRPDSRSNIAISRRKHRT